MTQIHILHAHSGKQFAEAAVRGLDREGYPAFWEAEHGAMSTKGLEHADRAVCIVFWTRDALYSKWVLEAAWKAARRGVLVEAYLESIRSPIEGVGEEPLDFAAWDGKPVGPLWKGLMARVRAAAGRPTGKLPLKEEAPPALVMAGLTFVAVATLAAGGLPDTRAQAGDAVANLAPETISVMPNATVSVGGPQLSLGEPESAAPVIAAAVPEVTARFERMDAPQPIQIIPLKDFDQTDRDIASAETNTVSVDPGNPNL